MPSNNRQGAKDMNYTIEIMGRRYSADSLQDASAKVASIRDFSHGIRGSLGYGASEMGSEFPVRDSSGKTVAIVSYNGKIWTPEPYPQRTLISGAAA
jgi:hypothetical protein